MSRLSHIVWTPFFLLVFMVGNISAKEVKEIYISAVYFDWTGAGKVPTPPSVQIKRKQDDYVLCFPAKSKNCTQPVDRNLVQRLVTAASQPPLEHLDISRLGITQGELNARALKAYEARKEGLESEWTSSRCEPPECAGSKYKQVFIKNYTDLQEVDHGLKKYYYHYMWDHASSGYHVTLTFKNGEKWYLNSFNQRHFLLPWTVLRSGKRIETYAPDIARAVHDLLPEAQFERKWLAGDLYTLWPDDLLIFPVMRDLVKIAATRTLGEKTKMIKSQFNILKMGIGGRNQMGLFKLGGLWEKKGMSPKVRIVIDYDINIVKTDNVAELVEHTNQRIQHILDIKWFRDWLEENKSNIDHWLIDVFREGENYHSLEWPLLLLKVSKFDTWKSKIEKQRKVLISITIEHEPLPDKGFGKFSKLLLFPNGEMVLWHTNMEEMHTWNEAKYGFQFSKDTSRMGRDDGFINQVVHFDAQGHVTVDYRDPSTPCYFPPPSKKNYTYPDCLKK